MRRALACLPALLCCLAAGCTPEVDPLEGLPSLEGLAPDPGRLPRPVAERPPTVSVSQILVTYRGALDAHPSVKLSRSEALRRAGHLLPLARAQGSDFADLAKRFSDDATTSLEGGDLGVVSPGQLHPDVEDAAFALGIGQVSEVIESAYGFHILLRHPPTEAQAAEIVIAFEGAQRYKPRQPRSREEAEILAQAIHRRLEEGTDFHGEALQHSDLPNHDKGGIYPIFRRGFHHPKFEEVVWDLPVGIHTGVMETPTGFHIVKRLQPLRIQTRHVLIKFRPESTGDDSSEDEALRSRSEAEALAEEVRRRALVPGTDFAWLVEKYSEDDAKSRGGSLDPFGRGQWPFPFDRAAFGLQVGEISAPVEADLGLFVIKRIR